MTNDKITNRYRKEQKFTLPKENKYKKDDEVKASSFNNSTPKANVLGRVGATIADAAQDVGIGTIGALNNAADWLSYRLIDAVNLFRQDDEWKQRAYEQQAQDGAKVFGIDDEKVRANAENNWASRNSYFDPTTKAGQIETQVLESVGGMLPSIVIGAATAGTGLAPGVAKAVGYTQFGTQAAGQATSQAIEEGNNYKKANLYGTLEGLKETGTELIGDAVGGKFFGTSLGATGSATSGIKKSVLKSLGKSFVEEGSEEVLGDLFEPFIDWVALDKDFTESARENLSVKNLLQDFVVGGLSGAVMGGADTIIQGKETSLARETLNDIVETNNYYKDLAVKDGGTLTEQHQKEYDNRTEQLAIELKSHIEKINSERKQNKVNEEAKQVVKTTNENYNENATLEENIKNNNINVSKEVFAKVEEEITKKEKALEKENNTEKKATIQRDIDNLERSTINKLKQQNAKELPTFLAQRGLGYKYNNQGNINDTYRKATFKQREVMKQTANITTRLNKISGQNVNITFAELKDGVNGSFSKANNTITINSKLSESEAKKQTLFRTLGHEFSHSISNGNVYKAFSKALLNNSNIMEELSTKDKAYKKVDKEYAKLKNNADGTLSQKQIDYLMEEIIADRFGDSLLSEKAFKSLIKENRTLAEKIVDFLKGKKKEITTLPKPMQELFNTYFDIYQKALLENNITNNNKSEATKLSVEEDIRYSLDLQTTQKNNVTTIDNKVVDTSDKVLTQIEEEKRNIKQELYEKGLTFNTQFVDAQAGIVALGKKIGMKTIDEDVNFVRSASSQADAWLSTGQFDAIGKEISNDSLSSIWNPIRKKGDNYTKDFMLYLLHYHNIDRMNFLKRVSKKQTDLMDANNENTGVKVTFYDLKNAPKPVFGSEVTATESTKVLRQLEKKYPDFYSQAEKVWKYNDNLLKTRQQFNLISSEEYDLFRRAYPHYVPTFRNVEEGTVLTYSNGRQVSKTVLRAKGSSLEILPIDVMMARQTMQVFRTGRLNELVTKIADFSKQNKNDYVDIGTAQNNVNDEILLLTSENYSDNQNKESIKKGEFLFRENGRQVPIRLPQQTLEGLDNYSKRTNNIPVVSGITRLQKKLLTDLNPFFTFLRNPIRDIKDAVINTTFSTNQFLQQYFKSAAMIKNNNAMWKEYVGAGGLYASIYDFNKGYNINNSLLNKYERVSQFIETLPRFTEYVLARQSGESIEKSIYKANDITVNFGRQGTISKYLNNNGVLFFSASVGGFNKIYRTLTRRGLKSFAGLLFKAFLLGISMDLICQLLGGDDYDKLPVRYRENYNCFKIGNTWIKIPKGRLNSIVTGFYQRLQDVKDGDSMQMAFDGYISNIGNQISPIDAKSGIRTIYAPIKDALNNQTWFGSAIESQTLQNYRKSDRYDDSDTKLAIAIGKAFNISPKKLDYVLDQYSGIVGDILIPLLDNKKDAPLSTIFNSMTINGNANKYSSNFYNNIDKLQEEYNSVKLKVENGDNKYLNQQYMLKGEIKYLNNIKNQIKELNDMVKIEKDSEVKRTLQGTINVLSEESIKTYKEFGKFLSQYELSEDTYEEAYLLAYQEMFGSESALKQYNENTYKKAVELNKKYRINYDTYFAFYFDTKDMAADYDKNGNVISGSRKKKIIAYINKLRLTSTQKKALLQSLGYK